MKKKNSMLVLAILVAVLVLGVGYAAVSAVNLTIEGSAKSKDSYLNVVFTGEVTTSTAGASAGAAISASSENDGLTATINVTGLQAVNDTVSATYTIKNKENDLSASIVEAANGITNSKSEFFSVSTDMTTAKTVAKGATTTVTVTVKLIKVPISDADSTSNISVKLEATPVNP